MKRQMLALLALGSVVAGGTALPSPASANAGCPGSGGYYEITWYDKGDFKSWEHPFVCDRNIRKMPQFAADAYCAGAFANYAEVEAIMHNHYVRSPHVWAHVHDGVCVYND